MKHTTLLTIAFAALCAPVLRAQDDSISISKSANFLGLTKPTPIAITGFSGEVEQVLKFDLTVMGFTNVPPDAAQYILSGSNNGSVQGQLSLGKITRTSNGDTIH